MKKQRKIKRKGLAVILMAALTVTAYSPVSVNAAKSQIPKLSNTKVVLTINTSKKISIKNSVSAKVKKVQWAVNKQGNQRIALSKQSKKGVVIKGLKKGSAKITVTIETENKTYQKTIQVTVKKKTTNSDNSNSSISENVTPIPSESEESVEEPVVYNEAGTVSAYDMEKTNYTLDINADHKVHDISDILYGIFIEDINFAADGGLYAEMVRNRSFEFTSLASNNEKHAWSDVGTIKANVIKDNTKDCLNANNPNYMVLENNSAKPAGIANIGFLDGMAVKENAKYQFSIYAKGLEGYTGPIHVAITNQDKVLAQGDIKAISSEWKKYELTLTSNATVNTNVKLQVTIEKGKTAIDMVSLFPEDTYKGRKNGLRKDLAEKLEELKPSFLRFPGGCIVEGVSLDLAYDWKDSIGVGPDGEPLEFQGTYGDVAARKQGQSIWTDERASNDPNPSFMSYGLGFYEYFLLAEDIGAIGVPVLNCGLSCMGQANGAGPAVDTKEFEQYVQDALDLVEFCKGDSSTKWGKVRIAMGHEKPFELKYIGIGNEQWGDNFFRHYEAFVDAFDKAKKSNPELYGDIELMFSAGIDDGDSGAANYMPAYQEAAQWLKEHPEKTISDFAGAIDHHYYNAPSWFLQNADYYDEKNYSRDTETMANTKFGGGIQVFLGEYAAQSNTLEAALAEAAYMTGLERNGDIVTMAAYAPLFGNLTALHWAPDLIWFNNHTCTSSINYYVQKIFSTNAGTSLLESNFQGADIAEKPFSGKVGVGTWTTSAKFDNVKIVNNDSGEVIGSDDFSKDNFSKNWQKISDGSWSVTKGELIQSSTATDTIKYGSVGTTAYFGNTDWSNYTYTVDAIKTGGGEGFLIPFAVKDSNNNYFWNIGGWGNTVSCLQKVSDGIKSDQIAGTVKNCVLKTGTTYKLKVVVKDSNIKCYINDELYVDYDLLDTANAESYQVVSTDETGDIIIKMVNVTGYAKTFAIKINGTENIQSTASLDLVAGNSLRNDNILEKEEDVTLVSSEISGISNEFNYTVPKYSVTVLRIKTK